MSRILDFDSSHGLLLEKTPLAPKVTRYVLRAPRIAQVRRPGQFIILRLDEEGERIPLTIADADPDQGTLTLVVQEVGKTTAELAARFEPGMTLRDLAGPLGMPTRLEKIGRVLAVGGGIGIAPLHPIAQGMTRIGNEVIAILGARTKDLLILEPEMRRACARVRAMTDDGSFGEKGFVTDGIRAEAALAPIDQVFAIGPVPMMKAVSALTRELGIPTIVSLNPIMVDGTGMCGGCRVTVGGKTQFVCVDGPEFDGHQVDFDELIRRQRLYVSQEAEQYRAFQEQHAHAPEDCRLRRIA